jgi:hypothetical protein
MKSRIASGTSDDRQVWAWSRLQCIWCWLDLQRRHTSYRLQRRLGSSHPLSAQHVRCKYSPSKAKAAHLGRRWYTFQTQHWVAVCPSWSERACSTHARAISCAGAHTRPLVRQQLCGNLPPVHGQLYGIFPPAHGRCMVQLLTSSMQRTTVEDVQRRCCGGCRRYELLWRTSSMWRTSQCKKADQNLCWGRSSLINN